MNKPVAHAEALNQALLNIAHHYGTPTYAYDVGKMRSQVSKLKSKLPREIDLLYSLKANPSLGISQLMAQWGLGADVASAGELLTALKVGFPTKRIFVSGPYKSTEVFAQLSSKPEVILSVDSVSELQMLAAGTQPCRVVLRLRPDYVSHAVVNTGENSRFGILLEDLPRCREYIESQNIRVIGFHVFSGSQMLDAATVIQHLRGAAELSLRAADTLNIAPEVLNLGGGFGIPYAVEDKELELEPIAEQLSILIDRLAPARIILELGRYLVAQSGWYLTTVVATQTNGRREAVVVDGGIHQRADLCKLGLRTRSLSPHILNKREQTLKSIDLLGCLCLPDDVLAEACELPPLAPGDVLAFPNAGAYGLTASPLLFLGHPAPAEVAFEGMNTELLRTRQPAEAFLEGQNALARLKTQHASPFNAVPDNTALNG